MALSEERKASLLAYCKLTELADDPDVQVLIPILYDGAVEYLADAGVQEPEDGAARSRYDLAVNAMVLDGWDKRGMTVTESLKDNPAFRLLVNQLKQTQPVSNPQTLADLGVS
ncbi:MAG TPA: phage gp6-like head-tail connector protein [Candidatus Enterenecus stercoripullorum]|nr:phage gp6-like head-tail connector protein [Candidatus Enterenecus stercoripullorum]